MGWEDRSYYREGSSRTPGSIFRKIFGGSVPFFTAFGIRVRIHATLIIITLGTILFNYSKGYELQDRIVSMGMLWFVIILHEFGHCFAARAVGGSADDILLWPLGGLAFTSPPHRPWPVFVTVIWGPLVNVIICLVCLLAIASMGGGLVSFNPHYHYLPAALSEFHYDGHLARYWIGYYLFWLYKVSYVILIFNLLPMFPMDFGQVLQTVLWPKLGYHRATHIACVTGMVVAVPVAIYGIIDNLNFLMVGIAVAAFFYCKSRLMMLNEGGEDYGYASQGVDYSASLRPDAPRKRRRVSQWTVRRLRRVAQRDAEEQQIIDNILAKVSAQGMHTLTWTERRALKRATDRQRKRDLELSRRD